jgi:hypothetical protein
MSFQEFKPKEDMIMKKQIIILLVVLGFAHFASGGWLKYYSENVRGQSVVQTYEGNYLAVGRNVLTKIDEHGDSVWTKTFGEDSYIYLDRANSIVKTDDSCFLITSYTVIPCSSVVHLLKVDIDGAVIWDKTYSYNSINYNFAHGAVLLSDGGFAVVGYTYSIRYGVDSLLLLLRLDKDGDTLWTKTYPWAVGRSIVQAPDGGFVIVGYSYLFGSGSQDVYVLRTDSLGVPIWIRPYGCPGNDYAYSVTLSADSAIIVAGGTCSFRPQYCWLLKLNWDGDTIWTRFYNLGKYFDVGFRSICTTTDGGYACAGTEHAMLKLFSNGDVFWRRNALKGYDKLDGNCIIQTSDKGFLSIGDYSNGAFILKTDSLGLGAGITEEKVESIDDFQIKFYPNPFNSVCSIDLPENSKLQILDLNGRLLFEQNHAPYTWKPDNSVSSGVYIVRATSNGKTKSNRIIFLR